MNKCFYPILWILLAASTQLSAQKYCKVIWEQASQKEKNGKYQEALRLLNDLEICDAANVFQKDRVKLRNQIFNAIEKQRHDLDVIKDTLAFKNRQLVTNYNALDITNRKLKETLDTLKKNMKREVNTLLNDAYQLETTKPFAALEKINNAITLLKPAENSDSLREVLNQLTPMIDKSNESLRVGVVNGIRNFLSHQQYPQAIALLPLTLQIPRFPVDSAQQLREQILNQLEKAINQNLEKSEYTPALENTHLLATFQEGKEAQICFYAELAFCLSVTQQDQGAKIALDSLTKYLPLEALPLVEQYALAESKQKFSILKQIIRQVSASCFQYILNRYLPSQFSSIPGGTTEINSCFYKINSFYLACKEVSFFEYDLFCTATKRKADDNKGGRGSKPAIDLSWHDAIAYCNWRSELEGLQVAYDIRPSPRDTLNHLPLLVKFSSVGLNEKANGYRLPFETEWQFAAGNGTQNTKYSWGNETSNNVASENLYDTLVKTAFPIFTESTMLQDSFYFTAPVGSFPPNNFQLYDMSGNVQEWCWDIYQIASCPLKQRKKKLRTDDTPQMRVVRGGGWSTNLGDAEVHKRLREPPDTKNFNIGFRIAQTIK